MIDARIFVDVGLFFVSISVITGSNLHLCMWCNKFDINQQKQNINNNINRSKKTRTSGMNKAKIKIGIE